MAGIVVALILMPSIIAVACKRHIRPVCITEAALRLVRDLRSRLCVQKNDKQADPNEFYGRGSISDIYSHLNWHHSSCYGRLPWLVGGSAASTARCTCHSQSGHRRPRPAAAVLGTHIWAAIASNRIIATHAMLAFNLTASCEQHLLLPLLYYGRAAGHR